MELTATAFRILRYLNTLSDDAFPSIETVKHAINESDSLKFGNAETILFFEKLIGGGQSNIAITPAGRIYLDKLELENSRLCENFVFDNYDYAVVNFLYINHWGVRLNEFPEILKDRVEQPYRGSKEMHLEHYLARSPFVDKNGEDYSLNNTGKALYIQKIKNHLFLNTREVHNVATTPIMNESTNKKRYLSSMFKDVSMFKDILYPLLLVIIAAIIAKYW